MNRLSNTLSLKNTDSKKDYVMKRKKGIVVVFNPQSLYRFIWYYCAYGKNYDWTAICLPNDYKGEYIGEYCEKSGIFSNIIRTSIRFSKLSILRKIQLSVEMFLHAITGQQLKFCKKFINYFIPYDEYDIAVVSTEEEVIPGMFIGVSSEKKTVILEDGTLDYTEKKSRLQICDVANLWNLLGYLLSKMGYASTVQSRYAFNKTKFCEKYASKPELMKYRNYKSLNKLGDMDVCDKGLYKEILKRIYPLPKDINTIDVVLCTFPYTDFVTDDSFVTSKIETYVNENYRDSIILLKKHPRDKADYHFDSSIKVIEIEQTVPAEIFFSYFKVKSAVFTWPSSILFSVDEKQCNIKVLYLEQVNAISSEYRSLYINCIQMLNIHRKNIIWI